MKSAQEVLPILRKIRFAALLFSLVSLPFIPMNELRERKILFLNHDDICRNSLHLGGRFYNLFSKEHSWIENAGICRNNHDDIICY